MLQINIVVNRVTIFPNVDIISLPTSYVPTCFAIRANSLDKTNLPCKLISSLAHR